ITEIEWELAPVPAHRAGVRLDLRNLGDLADATRALLALDPSAIEVLDRSFLEVAGETGSLAAGTAAVLLVELESDDSRTLRGRVGDAVRLTRSWTGDVATALTPDEEHSIWALRHAASPRIASLPEDRRSLQVIEDACVPLERIGNYIMGVRRITGTHGIPAVIFGHAGDGNIHVNLIPRLDQPGWAEAVEKVFEEVSALVLGLDGTTTGEHGDGRIRAGLLEDRFGPELIALFQGIKEACDPAGIMNPGVKLSDRPAPMSDLKAGADAVPLPEDISRALRSIERGGGYAQNRLLLADTP
ncbi:MAG: FAD-binding oxidoreductase, partial [Gemmatimonadales bacterium]